MKNINYDDNKINVDNESEANSEIKEKKKIYTINEFENNMANPEQIGLIEINTYNLHDLTEFSKLNLTYLEVLILKNNNISDIRPLTFAKCQNLKILNLESNKIGDDMIESVNNLNFPKLIHLNFNNNYFQDFKIFKAIEHFSELQYLNMSSNKFNENISHLKNVTFEFPSLKGLCLENGVFNNNSIILLSQFNLKGLIFLKLDNNNLSSLYFLDKLNSENLQELTLPKKDYEDKIYLIKFQNLGKENIDYFKKEEIFIIKDDIDNISTISHKSEDSSISFISLI